MKSKRFLQGRTPLAINGTSYDDVTVHICRVVITLQATGDIANAGTHNPTVFGNGRYRRRVKSYSSDLCRMQPCTLRNTPFAIFIRSVCCIDRIQLCQAFYLVYKHLFSCTVLTGSQSHVT